MNKLLMRQYYIQLANQQKGPYTLDQLRDIYFNKSTPIWYEGLQSWTTVQEVPEVNAILLTPPSLNKPTAEKAPAPAVNNAATPPLNQTTSKVILDKPQQVSEFPIEKKKTNSTLYIVLGLILVGIIGGLLYTNRTQSSEINKLSTQSQNSEAENEKKKLEEAINAKNKNYRNNWKKFIVFGSVQPSFDDFGGCDPFAVPIKNNTDQLLDEVDVELKYIKADGDVFKVERVSITNIPPHIQKEVTGPSSSRGISLEKQIVGVVSRGMHFCYPSNNGNADDPYLCN